MIHERAIIFPKGLRYQIIVDENTGYLYKINKVDNGLKLSVMSVGMPTFSDDEEPFPEDDCTKCIHYKGHHKTSECYSCISGVKSYYEENKSETLKPCPFCGGEAELREMHHVPNGYDYIPRCKNPSCAGRLNKKWSNKYTAISAWNRRG